MGQGLEGQYTWLEGDGAYKGIKGGGTFKYRFLFPNGGGVIDFQGSWSTD